MGTDVIRFLTDGHARHTPILRQKYLLSEGVRVTRWLISVIHLSVCGVLRPGERGIASVSTKKRGESGGM